MVLTIAGMEIVLLPGMYVRFESLRTRETLLEARRLGDDALIEFRKAAGLRAHEMLDRTLKQSRASM